ncbi:MAG: hypothetical protein WC554_13635 [Clostridia bacterium]|jgi:hypothetical protein
MNKLERLIDKIILISSGLYDKFQPWPGNKNNKPGKLIESLTPEERELLKTAKSKNFDVRLK